MLSRPRWPASALGPSPGDKLLAGAFGAKIEMMRCRDDDGETDCILQYEITGSIDNSADAKELLRALLVEFNSPEGGEGCNV